MNKQFIRPMLLRVTRLARHFRSIDTRFISDTPYKKCHPRRLARCRPAVREAPWGGRAHLDFACETISRKIQHKTSTKINKHEVACVGHSRRDRFRRIFRLINVCTYRQMDLDLKGTH